MSGILFFIFASCEPLIDSMGKLQKVWSDKDITLSTKLRLLNALVYPVLLYGSEIWTIKKNDLKKFVAFEMRC